MIQYFFLVSACVWAVWTAHDLWKNQVQVLWGIPLTLSLTFISNPSSLYFFGGLTTAVIATKTSKFGNGDAALLFGYMITTMLTPLNGIISLLIVGGTYMFLGQTFWKKDLPLAPGFTLSILTAYYLLPIAL